MDYVISFQNKKINVIFILALGELLGGPCKETCNPKLTNVYCDEVSLRCECQPKYPVKLGPTKGCAKRK